MSGQFAESDVTGRGYFMYVSEKTGQVKQRQLEYAIVEGLCVFEGDIVLGTVEEVAAAEDIGKRRLAGEDIPEDPAAEPGAGSVVDGCVIVGAQYRWPNGVIFYRVDPSFTNQQRVTDAIAHWEANTPIRFQWRTTETDYVRFVPHSSVCSSSVGRRGGRQDIRLAAGCLRGQTIHEIGHAVGLWHEQSREDRDDFVTVNYGNIKASKAHNFNQHIADGDDVGDYDYDSIMHYPRWAFSNNGDTITPPAGVTIGQTTGLSPGDIQAVIYMYGERQLYVGNKNTKELHEPDCRWVARMSHYNKKYFATQEEAITSNYNGCWYCIRHFDTG